MDTKLIEMKAARPSFLLDIPADEYHAARKARQFMSSHALMDFRRCPLAFRKRETGAIAEKDTRNFVVGRATHVLVLEGAERFKEEFCVEDGPINAKTGRPYGIETVAWQKWAEALKKPAIRTDEYETMVEMSLAVHGNPDAQKLLAGGIAEGSLRVDWDGVPCQARLDWFNPETGDLVDLKTCSDLDRLTFDVRDYGYKFQLAFYAKCLALAGYDKPVKCWLVFVEKKEPFRSAVCYVSSMEIEDINEMHYYAEGKRDDNAAMLEELRQCQESGVWPTRYEGVIYL